MNPDAPLPVSKEYFDRDELALGNEFISKGHIIRQVEDRNALDCIRSFVAETAARILELASPQNPGDFLDGVGQYVSPERLNDFRLAVYNTVNAQSWFRPTYFRLARQALETLVGNELAMQRRVNLSIQLPRDNSSLLPVHADVWSGDSPFEVVVWLPLVDCFGTKSMYLLPPEVDRSIQANFREFNKHGSEELFRTIEPHLLWLGVPYGNFLLFCQNLMHGNRANLENQTRWTMNCRFKGLFAPYADKRLGEFFEPVTLRPASRIGMEYRLPGGFDD